MAFSCAFMKLYERCKTFIVTKGDYLEVRCASVLGTILGEKANGSSLPPSPRIVFMVRSVWGALTPRDLRHTREKVGWLLSFRLGVLFYQTWEYLSTVV
ncbi:hypothetical protein TNCV_550961 [Trichonephila clavipes]|nr:hypothetical protein TNCV_550961 [Trichonephila clavipes]